MNWFEKIVYFLQGEMTEPTSYGWFHLLAFALVIAATVCLCIFFKDAGDKTYRRIILIGWCLMVASEIYKQVVFSFDYDGVTALWDYEWYAFPYQLCSTPLYVFPLVAFLKDGRLRDALMLYVGTFSFFGGLAVMFYPGDVFIGMIGINIQTMLHHGMQVAFGIFTMVHMRKKLRHLTWLWAVPVFALMVTVAILSNIIVYHLLVANGMDDSFNMFYVGPYFECTLPVLSGIYAKVPYAVFLCIYILGFGVVAGIMYYAQWGIMKLVNYVRSRGRSRA